MFVSAALLTFTLVTAPAGHPQSLSPGDADRAAAHYREGWALLGSEDWTKAAGEFQAAIDINRLYKLAYYGLGRAHMGEKRFVDAITAYERCRELYAGQAARNFNGKADAQIMMRDDLAQLDSAIQQLGGNSATGAARIRVQELQMQKQRFQSRVHDLDSMSLTSEIPPFVSLALGSAYFRSGRIADAEREYKAATDANPRYGEAWNNLAVVYLMTGRYDAAEAAVKSSEKAGYHVNPQLKADIRSRKAGG